MEVQCVGHTITLQENLLFRVQYINSEIIHNHGSLDA